MIQIKRGAATVATVNPTSSSNMSKAVMGEEQITLVWEAPAFVPFYLGDFITFEGSNWTLNKLPTVKKLSGKTWQYNAVFQSTKYELIKAMYLLFDNTDTLPSGEFPLTGTADTFIELLVANLNRVAGSAVWSVGQVLENTDYKNLTFSNEDCLTVLGRLADEFETEYHVSNHVIHLKKISTNREVTLQYGSTLYDIERSSVDSSDVCTRLYAFGSTKNLASDYRGGNSPLRLPDANGDYIESNVNLYGVIERAKTFDAIYPRLSSGGAGVITSVGDEFTFYDSHLDFNVNDYLLDGTTAKVHFNTGECAGYDFEIAQYAPATKKFVIIANTQENDFTLPSADLKPAVGDKYVLIDIVMPPAYLAAAEAELLAKAQEYISQNSTPKVAYKTTFSAIYAKQNLQSIECGDTVTVYDADMGINEQIRIIKLQKGLTDYWTVQIDLSNTVTATRLERIEGDMAAVENTVIVTNQRVNRNNLRAYQNTKELREMVFDPDGYFDAGNIKPLSIETSMLSVGSKSQSFQLSTLLQPNYAGNPQVLQWSAGLLTHFTIVDNAIKEWTFASGSITITGGNQTAALYIYARCSRAGTTGDIYLSATATKFDADATYYFFLIGVLHTPINSVRGISLTYGQTTINGQYIKTGVISSIDGATYFNLNTGEIGGNIKFKSTDGSYKTVDQAIGDIKIGGVNLFSYKQRSIVNYFLQAFSDVDPLCTYGFMAVGAQNDNRGVVRLQNVITGNGTYTLSFELRASQNITYPVEVDICDIGHQVFYTKNDNTWVYCVMTVDVTNYGDGSVYNFIDFSGFLWAYYFVRNIMVEKGNKATTFSVSPIDTQIQIDESLSLLADIASDNKLTPNEKQQLKKEWDDIYNEFPLIRDQANDILGAADSYEDAYSYLLEYITPLLANLTTTSDIAGSTLRSYFRGYYLNREIVKKDIQRAVDTQSRSLDFMKSAIENGSTEFQGGLGLINLLFQKTLEGVVNGGMSGLEGDNILNWGGATYQQAIADAAKAFGAAMSSAFLNKEDGSGHLAFGKIAWDLLGKMLVGDFSIEAGDIIGRNSAGAAKLKITTGNIPTSTELSSGISYTNGKFTEENLFNNVLPQGSSQHTFSNYIEDYVTIPYGTSAMMTDGAVIINLPPSLTLQSATQTVQVYSGNALYWSGAVNTSFNVPGGEYRVRLILTCVINDSTQSGGTASTGIESDSSRGIQYNESVSLSAFGLNGFFSKFSNTLMFYFSETEGVKARGKWDAPAGLGGASINGSGSVLNPWGKIIGGGTATGQVQKSGSNYIIHHNMNDSSLSVIATPISTAAAYISSKTANDITITCSGGFDFVIIRTQ